MLLVAPLAATAQAPTKPDRPLIRVDARWPETVAIGTIAPNVETATAVEATDDGWVVLTPLLARDEAARHGALTRVRVRPADALRWATMVRSITRARSDTTPRMPGTVALPRLGRGVPFIESSMLGPPKELRAGFVLWGCSDGVGRPYNVTPASMLEIATLLERAATTARRGRPQPAPPTLDRPYYASEVGCPARPSDANAVAIYPDEIQGERRGPAQVGVRFVVDTAGFVEDGSIAVLPDTPTHLVGAARTLVAGWRFDAAEWGEAPVRQIVTTVLTFDPDRRRVAVVPRPGDPGADRTGSVTWHSDVRASDDGRVQVRMGRRYASGYYEGQQEWYTPDSVDAWLVRVRGLLGADSALRRRVPMRHDSAITLGGPGSLRYEVAFVDLPEPDANERGPLGTLSGCGLYSVGYERVDRRLVEAFATASREARARRATPAAPRGAFAVDEVACAPTRAPIRVRGAARPPVWRHPTAMLPASMEPYAARAEVMASFVVDSNGRLMPKTLVAMPGSDPRAVAGLRTMLGAYRYEPGRRGGQRVPARIIDTWLFAPAPICDDESAGVECGRRYGPQAVGARRRRR